MGENRSSAGDTLLLLAVGAAVRDGSSDQHSQHAEDVDNELRRLER